MGLRKGYKRTEIGVIPEEWAVKQFRDIATPRKKRIDPRKSGVQSFCVELEHIEQGSGRLVGSTIAGEPASLKSIFQANDVLFGKLRAYLRKYWLADRQGVCSTEIWVLVANRKLVLPEFLFHHVTVDRFIETASTSYGTHMPRSDWNVVKNYEVAISPLPEQCAIVAVLSDVDALINELDKLIAKKRDIKQTVMQQLLTGKQRLPGFGGEWEVKRLGEVLKFQVGNPFSSAFFNEKEQGVRLVKNRDLKNDNQIFYYSGKYDPTFQVCDGDVLVGMDGDFLPCRWDKGVALLNQRVGRIVPLSGLDRAFVYYYLIGPLKEIEIATAGTTVKHLSHSDIEGIEKPLPTVPEQTAIATVFSDMDAEVAALEQKRDKIRALKQGMIKELFTGRIRLIQNDRDAEGKQEKKFAKTRHNWAFNEAVVISVLVKQFGNEDFPLGRKRYTKFSYLLHRHKEIEAKGYLKKAGGPYNPDTKYKGPEAIAQRNGYIRTHMNGLFSGFVASYNVVKAEAYFQQWYGLEVLQWTEQFRFKTNDELELITTVDMAIQDLLKTQGKISLQLVKNVIRSHPEWKAKLRRPIFADANIEQAIIRCQALFGGS